MLLARLFTQPSNVLVLDEPTNDLDTETLELLEELLLAYSGTVLLVSHDRAFLNNVVTSTLVFEGDGHIGEYIGGYDDWLRQRRPTETTPQRSEPKVSSLQRERQERQRKRSYKEQRELEALPQHIESLEHEQAEIHARLSDSELYRRGGAEITTLQQRLDDIERELAQAYERWEVLEALPQ